MNMAEANPISRLEAFCDGVFAIALTLLIIDVRIPPTTEIHNNAEFWQALRHVIPLISSFLLSFAIILITWVNHHNALKLVNKSCSAFLYANGFLLLTVVFIPFPTSLLGEHLLTNHAAPAVILYSAVLVLQAIGWILISQTGLRYGLARSEKTAMTLRKSGQYGYYSIFVSTMFAVLSIWFPRIIAILIALMWLFWLGFGIRLNREEKD